MAKLTLADLEATSVPFELKHPKTGDLLGVSLELLGPDSPEFRKMHNAFLTRRLAQSADVKPNADEIAEQLAEILSVCVVGWSDDEFFGGPFDKAKVLAIFKNPNFGWIRDQVDQFTNDRKNFFR